jgi:hypothetical protein
VDLSPGNHANKYGELVHGKYDGAHWAMADVTIAIDRRLRKKARQSQSNFQKGLTSHDWHITREEIEAECKCKEDLPQVIKTVKETW